MDYKVEENEKYAQIIKEKVISDRLPVAVKFINDESEIPKDMEKIDEKLRHCEMIREASFGKVFYSTGEEQKCVGGASAMGLVDLPPKIASGEFYYDLGRFDSVETAKKVIDTIPRKDERSYGILYAPLEKAEFEPDVVVIITTPKYGMQITQAIVYNSGSRVEASFAGIQSLCADAVSGPYTLNKPNATLACDGSRGYAGIKDEEIIYGIPKDSLMPLIEAFEEL